MFNITYSSDKRIFPKKKQVIVLEIKAAVTQTRLHNVEKTPGCVRRGRYDVQKNKYLIDSSERKAAVVMHKNEDKTRKKENMDGRHRQTGRDQALPHEAPESNPSQKTKQKGGSGTEKTDSESATEKKRENHPSGGGEEQREKPDREINR